MGGPTTLNAAGVYGTRGTAQAANVPGARTGSVSWTDPQGNFWLFGGLGCDSSGSGLHGMLNDLWEYSPSIGQWTWVTGSNIMNDTGVYGTQGVAAPANVPPARTSATSWTDAGGNLWVFGGEGVDTPTHSIHRFNDLWKYSPSNNQWTWVAGSNIFDAPGVYGTQGVAAATNVLGARAATSAWKDSGGNVWLFGGYQYDDSTNTRFEMNDLWMYPRSAVITDSVLRQRARAPSNGERLGWPGCIARAILTAFVRSPSDAVGEVVAGRATAHVLHSHRVSRARTPASSAACGRLSRLSTRC